jgi:hypothetical protein
MTSRRLITTLWLSNEVLGGVELILGEFVLFVQGVDTAVNDAHFLLGHGRIGVGWHLADGEHSALQFDR